MLGRSYPSHSILRNTGGFGTDPAMATSTPSAVVIDVPIGGAVASRHKVHPVPMSWYGRCEGWGPASACSGRGRVCRGKASRNNSKLREDGTPRIPSRLAHARDMMVTPHLYRSGLSVTVKAKAPSGGKAATAAAPASTYTRYLVQSSAGYARPGEVLGIMGPSG